MEKKLIEPTDKSPAVILDNSKGLIEFEGRSLIEDSEKFFMPIVEWIIEYLESPAAKTEVNFKFEYFNTSCSKWLITITKQLKKLFEIGADCAINWFYEDEDVLEYGEVIRDLVDIPINMIPVDDDDDDDFEI
ncbi:MAG: DUF1987 domain-containing protein [Bacteroidales bacterium]|nr:DUF1987 domain-containing protein [Bacteroidales bacterium]